MGSESDIDSPYNDLGADVHERDWDETPPSPQYTTYCLEELVPSEGFRAFKLKEFCHLRSPNLEVLPASNAYCCFKENAVGFPHRAVLIELNQDAGRSAWLRIERQSEQKLTRGLELFRKSRLSDRVRGFVCRLTNDQNAHIACTGYAFVEQGHSGD